MQRQHTEDVVVEQPGFADLGAIEQFGNPGDEIALFGFSGGRDPRGLDAAGDAGEDAALGVGPGAAGSGRLPFAQVVVLGAGVGKTGADVGGVGAGGGEGGHTPVACEGAGFPLPGFEPLSAASGGVFGLGRGDVGAGGGRRERRRGEGSGPVRQRRAVAVVSDCCLAF